MSDVTAMGAPSPTPAFSPTSTYNQGYAPAGPPPPYQQGFQVDPTQEFAAPDPSASRSNVII